MPIDPSKPLRRRRNNCDPERFCHELLAGVSLKDAYEIAGFKRPEGNAARLERDPAVSSRLDFLRKRLDEDREMALALRRIRTRRILENYRDEDRSKMFNSNGTLKGLDELSEEQRLLIESMERTKFGIKVTMPSKLAAAAQLAKLDGLDAPERAEFTGKDGSPLTPTIIISGHPESPSAS